MTSAAASSRIGSISSSYSQAWRRAALLDRWDAALGAAPEGLIVGVIVLAVRWLYFRFRGHHGLGLGDVKLLAAAAVWIGVAGIPMQLLVGSITALIAAVALHFAGPHHDAANRSARLSR